MLPTPPADQAGKNPETPTAETTPEQTTKPEEMSVEKDKSEGRTSPDSFGLSSPPIFGSPSAAEIAHRASPKSTASFRVLTECPLIVMLMFQLYPKFLKTNIPVLITVMTEALALRAPPISPSQASDPDQRRFYYARARELVAAQAKTLSFLTYLLRGFGPELKPYEERLATNVVELMKTCQRESISTRKELLVATRHLLNSDFRRGFFRHIDTLFDERVLMGTYHRHSDLLRPLVFTTLSDFVHHVRAILSMTQMSRVVSTFSRVLHDSTMTVPMSIQYAAVRSLISVVDIILNNKDPDPQLGRDLLVRILDTLVHKLQSLIEYFPVVQKAEEARREEEQQKCDGSSTKSDNSNRSPEKEDRSSVSAEDFPKQLSVDLGTEEVIDTVRDAHSLIRVIVIGHKSVIWSLNNYRLQREKDKPLEAAAPNPSTNDEVASALKKLTNTERDLIDKFILFTVPCLKFFRDNETEDNQEWGKPPNFGPVDSSKPTNASRTPSEQYRDVLTYFAVSFNPLDPVIFRQTIGRRLGLIIDEVVNDPLVMLVPRHFLVSSPSCSFEFCSLLLDFLVQRMDQLSTMNSNSVLFIDPPSESGVDELERLKELAAKSDETAMPYRKRRANALLHLFERAFKSLSTYPENEVALRPYLRKIVECCLNRAVENTKDWPDNYCILLRYLFRSISAGKFEESYKELFPIIPTVLNGLYRIFCATDDSTLRHLVIEFCLTIPARLSSLLPHMSLLLRVIIPALESSSGDLVNLG
jgi:transformation/transcription domain-associated protein